jgi:hypothetical protein
MLPRHAESGNYFQLCGAENGAYILVWQHADTSSVAPEMQNRLEGQHAATPLQVVSPEGQVFDCNDQP